MAGLSPVHKYDILKVARGSCHAVRSANCSHRDQTQCCLLLCWGHGHDLGCRMSTETNIPIAGKNHVPFVSWSEWQASIADKEGTDSTNQTCICLLSPRLRFQGSPVFLFFFIPSFSLNCNSLRCNGREVWPVLNKYSLARTPACEATDAC